MSMRIGQGYDVHAFCDGNFIMLGGIKVPHTHGVIAHSDGDVLIHALCDALLGALALGDIGEHFPDTDASYAGADSGGLLVRVCNLIAERGWRLGNADITLIAQAPKVLPYKQAMRARLADLMQVDIDQISVKATTTEKLGFEGRKEGLAALASVLLTAI